MSTIVALGEMLMRLSPPGYQKLIQAQSFDVMYGGSEANVLIALAGMGKKVRYVSRLPENDLGRAARNTLRHWGVQTEYLAWGGKRLGIYYMEQGAAIRPSDVVYDRADSAAAGMEPGMFDWKEIFRDADWFHFSGITPAISKSAADVTREAVRTAKQMGLTISCDLNYRGKLWSVEDCRKTMIPLMESVDVVLGSTDDCTDCLGIVPEAAEMNEAAAEAAKRVSEEFSIPIVAGMMRENRSVIDKGWSALICENGIVYPSRHYELHTVDLVGTGDAFCAGLIYGIQSGKGPEFTVNYALAASALVQTIPGDFSMISDHEILPMVEALGNQDIKR